MIDDLLEGLVEEGADYGAEEGPHDGRIVLGEEKEGSNGRDNPVGFVLLKQHA